MSSDRDQLILGRYSREECGLPPLENPLLARWKSITRGLAVLAAVVIIGWLAGGLAARWRGKQLESLPREVLWAKTPGEQADLLVKGRMLATALRDDPHAILDLAEACLLATTNAPRQIGYYGNIATLLAGVGERLAADPFQAFRSESLYSMVLSELGRYPEALAALGRADKDLAKMPESPLQRSFRLVLVNQQAYILATAQSRQIRNPEKALHLAQMMISSRDLLITGEHASASAAFVDTLAAAWFAAGEADKAREAQTLALGLANSQDLAIYLKHYDQYAQAGPSRVPRLIAKAW